ncbi:MAG: ostA-like family protein [Alphaproteobacteria bacterium]|nr:ostA-like family protein [Alphaproteobacteria bacterium]
MRYRTGLFVALLALWVGGFVLPGSAVGQILSAPEEISPVSAAAPPAPENVPLKKEAPQKDLNAGLRSSGNEPLEITADGMLEWLRNEKLLIARKNAVAAQGLSSVAAQLLQAEYREGAGGGGMQIWKITAETDVVLKSQETQAYGQKAVYDLDKGVAVMTGDNLKMVSPDQTVTARDRFEYRVNEGRFEAIGAAKIVRPKPQGGGVDTLSADKIAAVMQDNAQGERVLHSMEATGHVVIVTPTETVTGAYGIYKAQTNRANLSGGVKIIRGPNTLEGERAEVDMNTNTSKIFGNDTATGRVRGVFYPGSEKKPGK